MDNREVVTDWLKLLDREIRIIILSINGKQFDGLFDGLTEIINFSMPRTDVTAKVKSMIGSLHLTDPKMVARHVAMQNTVVRRLMDLHYSIQQEIK